MQIYASEGRKRYYKRQGKGLMGGFEIPTEMYKMNPYLYNYFQEGSAAGNNRAGKREFYSNPLLGICGIGAAKQLCRRLENE